MFAFARKSLSLKSLRLAAGAVAASVTPLSGAEAAQPTFEVTVERSQIINVTGASARVRMVLRVGWLECKANPSPVNFGSIP
jgi:hypothetical protein